MGIICPPGWIRVNCYDKIWVCHGTPGTPRDDRPVFMRNQRIKPFIQTSKEIKKLCILFLAGSNNQFRNCIIILYSFGLFFTKKQYKMKMTLVTIVQNNEWKYWFEVSDLVVGSVEVEVGTKSFLCVAPEFHNFFPL